MKKYRLLSLIMVLGSSPVYSMTEQECSVQANTAYTLLEMVESGVIPASQSDKQRLERIVHLINEGRFCEARELLLNVQKNMGHGN
ncbi:hypothetical protein [Vibrio agarivorans]|uniref:hypothetical protein n=1 Tax=Vibrio agarivorans TaxID=153622 RepID=UPI0025B60A2B|nr:hypothetical protein [Vibrio agarivorans]MDN3661180.1 hypothetical protein [Vibrio agarivorans]